VTEQREELPATVLEGGGLQLRWRQGLLALILVLGLVVAGWSGSVLLALAVAAMFGGLLVWLTLQSRGGYRLLFRLDGLRWELGRKEGFVPWGEIEEARAIRTPRARSLELLVRDKGVPEVADAQLVAPSDFGRALGGGDVSVPLDMFSVAPQEVADRVNALVRDPALRARLPR
jgi:hypothetical protein